MTSFNIGLALHIPAGIAFAAESFPNLTAAVEQAAFELEAAWKASASVHAIKTGGYLRSIQRRHTGLFSAEAYSDSPYAGGIEDGMPARDMKRMLDTSLKVRLSKKGERYLIIPFRWGTFNPAHEAEGVTATGLRMMQAGVSQAAKALEPSHVKGMGIRVSGTGAWDIKTRAPATVAQREYKWGGRLREDQIHAAGTVGEIAKRMTGMVKFQNPAGETGGSKHSQYLTFRVMSENSRGWMAPAVPGKHIARDVAAAMEDRIRTLLETAVVADIRAAYEG